MCLNVYADVVVECVNLMFYCLGRLYCSVQLELVVVLVVFSTFRMLS